jgi:chromosomal replication initiation ATPase DnaA
MSPLKSPSPAPGLLPQPAANAEQLCRRLEFLTAAAFAVSVDEMRARSRRARPVAFARQSAMYLAHVMLGLSYSATGRLFDRDRTTAAYACRLVEDRRDDPAVDHVLLALEDVCGALARDAGLNLPV